MTIILNHTIVPARDKLAAARWFATIFGLNFNEQENDHFAPVRVNETLTLLFDQDTSFDSHHYAFHAYPVTNGNPSGGAKRSEDVGPNLHELRPVIHVSRGSPGTNLSSQAPHYGYSIRCWRSN